MIEHYTLITTFIYFINCSIIELIFKNETVDLGLIFESFKSRNSIQIKLAQVKLILRLMTTG